MSQEDEIVNKVAGSGLVTLDLEDYYMKGERVLFDIKEYLFEGLLLREKDFREALKQKNWSEYDGKLVAIHCSSDAIVPTWAYMLISIYLAPYAKKTVFGNLNTLETVLYDEVLGRLNPMDFKDARVVIKGCGNLPVPISAYVEVARILRPFAKSIMYGEPCSTVPLFKSKQV